MTSSILDYMGEEISTLYFVRHGSRIMAPPPPEKKKNAYIYIQVLSPQTCEKETLQM